MSSPELDPVFWTPHRLGKPSAWWAHVPFALWVINATRPRVLVELGTHNGVSYAAFCEAVLRARLATRCYAVDTWAGDAHAGAFDEQVYGDLRDFHDKHFGAFSDLLRCTFDDALGYFEDGSIDLLHIDGFHTYEAVKHDFETWRPKLSDRAVVMFHDTNVHEKDFGVYRFFGELAKQHPSFEFLHGYGLGVVAVGEVVPTEIRALCAMDNPAEVGALRERFAHLGARWLVMTREQLGAADLHQRLAQAHSESAAALAALEADVVRRVGEAVALKDQALADSERALAEKEQALAEKDIALAEKDHALAEQDQARAEKLRADEETNSEASAQLPDLTQVSRQELEAEVRLRLDAAIQEKEQALAEAAKAGAAALAAEKLRERAASRVVELRDAAEGLRAQAADASAKFASLAKRYASASDHPSLGVTGNLHFHARRLMARLRRRPHPSAGMINAIRSSIYFDRDWYLLANPDVAASGADAAMHYALYGAGEGREPGPWFSGSAYLECNPDVAASGINPLYHYLEYGQAEGRRGGPELHADIRPAPRVSAESAGALSILYVSGEPNSPGNQYRVIRYIDAAHANGAHAEWITADVLEQNLDRLGAFDILVIWRATWSVAIETAATFMRSRGRKVVFDVDDLMIDPSLARTEIIDGIRSQHLKDEGVRDHYEMVRRTMQVADLCFTTTEELAFHMRWAKKTTHVLPNGFDERTHEVSRLASRNWRRSRQDNLIRIGYAGGSRTHQRDLGLVIEAIAKLLRRKSDCRLVLFRTSDGTPLIDVEEYPLLADLHAQIEWRPLQLLANLPNEMARFDINIAPLEFGNPFCEAKSELKFFEAALVNVPTIASPTGPFNRAIEHGKTGFLAGTGDDWYEYLGQLADSPELRNRIARGAYHSALAKFGPLQRTAHFGRVLDQLQGGQRAGRGFALDALLASRPPVAPRIYPSEVVFEQDQLGAALVTVIIPLYNYEGYVVEALESVRAQSLKLLDLVIVDGHSTDDSLAVATKWARRNAARFNRVVVLKNLANYGLGFCRNSGFDAADTPYVLPLDADNKLLPTCCEVLLDEIRGSGCAFVYPIIQHFGASTARIDAAPYEPHRFVAGNYVDAMAMVSKEAWALVGGYDHVRHGWEDYDFWCRLAELGVVGRWKSEVLAEYRVHPASMMKIQTTVPGNYRRLQDNFKRRHPWVSLVDMETRRDRPKPDAHLRDGAQRSRIDTLIPLLRCPVTGQKLAYDRARGELLSFDGLQAWPVIEGRPVMAPDFAKPEIKGKDHISNELPEEALDIIRNTKGWVLNLSGGGSREKFEHVVEVEYAIFRHTDVVSDAHELPFDDEVFEAVVVMNAFEHYREPRKVVSELLRVLKPGGRIHVRTAFMQPLHERPWHFFNCTKHGFEEWFKSFETERLHVSDNFCPNHSIAWMASEAETALRSEVSAASGDNFRAATLGQLVDIWRDPGKRDTALWKDFTRLSQPTQEVFAAGFEFFGRKPAELPRLDK